MCLEKKMRISQTLLAVSIFLIGLSLVLFQFKVNNRLKALERQVGIVQD